MQTRKIVNMLYKLNGDIRSRVKSLKGVSMKKICTAFFFFLFIASSYSDAGALCVNVQNANIRVGPGTNYDKIWEVYKYMPFKKVGVSTSGDWYAVQDVDGDVNWIHKKLVTSQYKCAVVTSEEVNIRTGPGTKYQKNSSGPAKKYYSFKILKKQGSWVKVKDDLGVTGWIHTDYIWIQ